MSRASPIQTSFNAGELSRRMDGRIDFERYRAGCRSLLNVVPLLQGPVCKRSGSRFVASAKHGDKTTRLVPFEFNVTQAYVIEMGDQYFRFFTNNGRIETAPDVAYEVSHPFLEAQLADVDHEQSADVLYLVHGSHQPRKLSRTSATTFALSTITFKGGPFKKENTDETITVYASAATGTGITLTASSAIFQPGHVGALFYIAQKDFKSVKAWEPDKTITVNDLRRSDGKVYKATAVGSGAKTGTVQPTHTKGEAIDGDDGVTWAFQHAGFGIVRITAYSSGTSVTADVETQLPESVIGAPQATYRWAHGAFSDVEGWPTCVALHQERLWLAKGSTVYGSVVGDYENYAARDAGGVLAADQAITWTLGGGRVDQIQWMKADQGLLIGTAGWEALLGPASTNEGLSPFNIQSPPQSRYGSRKTRPALIGEKVIFIQRAGRKVLETGYEYQANKYVPSDMTLLATHLTAGGLVELAYQQNPDNILWAVRADGVLLSATHSNEQNVRAWAPHRLAGSLGNGAAAVKSVACIPDPDGDLDQPWLLVQRTINGATVQFVEYLAPLWAEGDAITDAFYVDAGATYDGAPATIISGLDYLEGETVAVLADGAAHPDKVVTGGQITLDRSASKVHVGLFFPAHVQTMRLEAGGDTGPAQGKVKRIHDMTLRFLDTLGVEAGPDEDHLDEILFRSSADAMDAPPALFNGDIEMGWPGDYDTDGYVLVKSVQPLPMTLLAAMPRLVTAEG